MNTENLAVEPAVAEVQPTEPVVTPSATEGQEGAGSAPVAEPSEKPDRDKIQERFDKLTREKYDERRAREAAGF